MTLFIHFIGSTFVCFLQLIITLYNNSGNRVCSEYCESPSQQEASLLFLNEKVLRATIIRVYPQTSSPAACSALCIGEERCYYIGLNFRSQTCTLLATAGGPSRTFLFDQLFRMESKSREVSLKRVRERMRDSERVTDKEGNIYI